MCNTYNLITITSLIRIFFSYFRVVTNEDKQSTWDKMHSVGPWIRQRVKSACRKKILYKRIPVLTWLPKYSGADAVGDLVAGITVGLTVIPQALAYAGIAGLDPAVSTNLNVQS